MTLITDAQKKLVANIEREYMQAETKVRKLTDDYEYAVYLAKQGLRQAVAEAREQGVPMRRIASDGMGSQYPQQVDRYLSYPHSVTIRLAAAQRREEPEQVIPDEFEPEAPVLYSVYRHDETGTFSVIWEGKNYEVRSFGPDSEAWTSREEDIPQQVYDLIIEKYPSFVVLDEDDEL